MYTIKNDKLIAQISNKAAEVHSLRKINEDYNYVWSADPAYWSGRNPILFPQVGHTSDKTIKIDGIKREIGNHGFARNSDFNLIENKEDELTLELTHNEETLKVYPFEFSLKVNYKLIDNKLVITYTIKNNSKRDMYYGFGLHPAFACEHKYKDCKVIFNKEEKDGKEIITSQELFDKYETYHIDNPKSTLATLVTGDRSISIEYVGYNIFAIWSKGDFVCLEPWINHSPDDPEIELKDRENTITLNQGEEKVHTYTWIVNK